MISSELLELFKKAPNGVTTDSRSCGEGMLFFALKGENFDGNKYATEAIKAGCIAAIVDDNALEGGAGVIVVEDVLLTLQELAREYRRTFDVPVIGLTGSNGKTTTKELITAVLSKKFKVHSTKGNLNNHIGVPLTLLSAAEDVEVLVVEMGANHLGEIASLCEIAEPDHGLITNIGRAHLEGFGGIDGVKKGKSELFDFLRSVKGSKAFVHSGHPVLVEVSQGLTRVLYGTTDNSPSVEFILGEGRSFVWSTSNYKSPPLPIQLSGDYNLDNIAAAIAVGLNFGVEPSDIGAAISSYTPTNNRSQTLVTGRNRVLLDAYNANPSSMSRALESFAKNVKGDRLVVLGDMRELGAFSHESHKEIVALCDRLCLDALFVGGAFYSVTDGGKRFFDRVDDLKEVWEEEGVEGKTVLLKGSRGMRMEQLLPLL
jgi:UDP-N-acetylmuramoyl-tripeptide--D-alanyl-D-alanine ligase